MRESLKRILADPAISGACKISILTDAVEQLEATVEHLSATRTDLAAKLAIAGSVMDTATSLRYIKALANLVPQN